MNTRAWLPFIGLCAVVAACTTPEPPSGDERVEHEDLRITRPFEVAVSPEGVVYVAGRAVSGDPPKTLEGAQVGYEQAVVARVEADGTLAHVAGGGSESFQEAGTAEEVALAANISGVEVADDGTIYLSNFLLPGENGGVFRIESNRAIERIAGGGGITDDDQPATESVIGYVWDIDLTPSGAIYIAEWTPSAIRRITPDGKLELVAGQLDGLKMGYSGDGGPAVDAQLKQPRGIAVREDGSFVIADGSGKRVREVSSDGTITTIGGGGDTAPRNGVSATTAKLGAVTEVGVHDPTVYFVEAERTVYEIDQGELGVVAGGGNGAPRDGAAATEVAFGKIVSLAVAEDGTLYVVDSARRKVFAVDDGRLESVLE